MHQDLFESGDGIYLLAHSIGKMPITTSDVCQTRFFDIWRSAGEDIWPHWLAEIERFNSALAELFNAKSNEFCPQSNISSGLSKLITTLPKSSSKSTILMTEHDFPSAGFVMEQAKRLGFTLRIIEKAMDCQDPQTWSDHLTDDVAAVFITHVHYSTNRLVPVELITAMARERGIFSMVDIAQSSGIVPIDLSQWQADVVFGSCIKWLCGGPGAGFLWIDSNTVQSLEPIDVGWFSHKNPFEFDIHHFEYADDSKRFWGGTPSVLPYIVATNSIQLLNGIGIPAIRQHNVELSRLITDNVRNAQCVSPDDPAMKGGTTVLTFDKQDEVTAALSKANIKFDARKNGVRLSPHIYTSQSEIETLLTVIG